MSNNTNYEATRVSSQGPKPIEVYIPEDSIIHYADTFTLQRTPYEVIISFLQTQHPIALTEEAVNKIETVECFCLARIALTPARFDLFLEMLNEQKAKMSEDSQTIGQKEGE